MAYRYGLKDIKIATWNSTDSYGTAVDLDAAQQMDVAITTTNAQLEGDDVIKDTHAKPIGVTVRIRNGNFELQTYATLFGLTVQSGTGYQDLNVDGTNRPYIGVCGRVEGTGDGEDTHIFVPKAKVIGDVSIAMQYGQYVIPELELQGVDDTTYGLVKFREHDSSTAISIPPV